MSKSRSLSASCQARTVAISEVVMVETYATQNGVRVSHPSQTPASPKTSTSAVGGRPAAHDGQQQILRASAQCGVGLAVLVRQRDPVVTSGDRPLTRGAEAVVGGMQMQRPAGGQR